MGPKRGFLASILTGPSLTPLPVRGKTSFGEEFVHFLMKEATSTPLPVTTTVARLIPAHATPVGAAAPNLEVNTKK